MLIEITAISDPVFIVPLYTKLSGDEPIMLLKSSQASSSSCRLNLVTSFKISGSAQKTEEKNSESTNNALIHRCASYDYKAQSFLHSLHLLGTMIRKRQGIQTYIYWRVVLSTSNFLPGQYDGRFSIEFLNSSENNNQEERTHQSSCYYLKGQKPDRFRCRLVMAPPVATWMALGLDWLLRNNIRISIRTSYIRC